MNLKGKIFMAAMSLAAIIACSGGDKKAEAVTTAAKEVAESDSMVYGLVCEGTNDKVIVFYPFADNANPIQYNMEDASRRGKVIGQLKNGDWVGIIINPEDSAEVVMAVNLDQLKGTWTHTVYPTWKDASRMSPRALRRRLAELPDSLKEMYMVPREYGFTLKRSKQASPVGVDITQASTEDSPVEYPEMNCVTGWKCHNGHLILTSVPHSNLEAAMVKKNDKDKNDGKIPGERHDTLGFVLLTADSLVLQAKTGQYVSFHRNVK